MSDLIRQKNAYMFVIHRYVHRVLVNEEENNTGQKLRQVKFKLISTNIWLRMLLS